MTKRILIFLFILSISLYPQKVNVEVDEFTGDRIISTSWQNLHSLNSYYYRFIKYNDDIYFEFAAPTFYTSIFTESSTMKFKADNDDIITLYNQEYKISSKGGGSIASFLLSGNISIYLSYKVEEEDLYFFENNLVKLMRYNFTTLKGGNNRNDNISNNNAKKLQKTYKMFKEEIDKLNVASN